MKQRSIAVILAATLLTGMFVAIVSWRHHHFSTTQLDFTNSHTTQQLPRASYNDDLSIAGRELHRHLRVTTGPGQTFEADVESVIADHSGDQLKMLTLNFEPSSRDGIYKQALSLGKMFGMSPMDRLSEWKAGHWKGQSLLIRGNETPLPSAELTIWPAGDEAWFIALTIWWEDLDVPMKPPNLTKAYLPSR